MSTSTRAGTSRSQLYRAPFNRRSSSPTTGHKNSLPAPLKTGRSLQMLFTLSKRPSTSSMSSAPGLKIRPNHSFDSNVTTNFTTRTTEFQTTTARSDSASPYRRQSLTDLTLKALGRNSLNMDEMEIQAAQYDSVMRQFQLRKVSGDPAKQAGTTSNTHHQISMKEEEIVGSRSKPKFAGMISWLSHPIHPNSAINHWHSVIRYLVFHTQVFMLPFRLTYGGHAIPWFVIEVVEFLLIVDLVLTCNTAYFDQKNQCLVTSRRAILEHYARSWLAVDLLSSIPIQIIYTLVDGTPNTTLNSRSLTQSLCIALASLRLVHLYFCLWRSSRRRQRSVDESGWSWLWYSRYAHLVSITKLLWLVVVVVHYVACIRHGVIDIHQISSIDSVWSQYSLDTFNAICLLQGQGDGTRTDSIATNLFSTLTVLLGSVLLAIVFGNVAVLVANFNANNTNYQRKLEAVVATMDKLHLPDPLRRRIHEYYLHLWSFYESLDGDVSSFSKELSHALALEVGLCRYMNLIVGVPFWRNCSPDFVTQIVLQLDVRVYLPDDFVFRQGEVGTELFMINHGTCDVFHGESFDFMRPGSSWNYSMSARDTARAAAGRMRLKAGGVLGEMSLLMNYRRTATVLAVTHVEMCILKRETFQRLIARYPEDRNIVLRRILQSCVERSDKPFPWQELCAMVGIDPDPLTPMETADLLLDKIDHEKMDPSIHYGFQASYAAQTRHPTRPDRHHEHSDNSLRYQVEEIQRSQSALVQSVRDLVTVVRNLESKMTQSEQSARDSVMFESSTTDLTRDQYVRKKAPHVPIRLPALRSRVHATFSRRSLDHNTIARNALPLSTRLWAQNTPEHMQDNASTLQRPLHRRQSLSPHIP